MAPTRMISRRAVLAGGALALASAAPLKRASAAAQVAAEVTSELVAAAQKEGKVVFYTAMDVQLGAQIAKGFEAKYPGVAVQVERSGAERIFQRVAQEYASDIHQVDALDSTDAAHLLAWKAQGLLAPYLPQEVTRWPAPARDEDGCYAVNRATLSVIGYNTRLVKAEDAPRSYADLLDPKWKGKIVKAHPGYSGNIMTATFVLSRLLGWGYFEKLARQKVMQVQSSTEPPKKLALGERAVMVDGNEYNALLVKREGAPIAIVYPTEGVPLLGGSAGVARAAPHPHAARLFIHYLFSREGQQLLVDEGEVRSFHPEVMEPAARVKLSELKLLTADPREQEQAVEEIRRKYREYFGT